MLLENLVLFGTQEGKDATYATGIIDSEKRGSEEEFKYCNEREYMEERKGRQCMSSLHFGQTKFLYKKEYDNRNKIYNKIPLLVIVVKMVAIIVAIVIMI